MFFTNFAKSVICCTVPCKRCNCKAMHELQYWGLFCEWDAKNGDIFVALPEGTSPDDCVDSVVSILRCSGVRGLIKRRQKIRTQFEQGIPAMTKLNGNNLATLNWFFQYNDNQCFLFFSDEFSLSYWKFLIKNKMRLFILKSSFWVWLYSNFIESNKVSQWWILQ